ETAVCLYPFGSPSFAPISQAPLPSTVTLEALMTIRPYVLAGSSVTLSVTTTSSAQRARAGRTRPSRAIAAHRELIAKPFTKVGHGHFRSLLTRGRRCQ